MHIIIFSTIWGYVTIVKVCLAVFINMELLNQTVQYKKWNLMNLVYFNISYYCRGIIKIQATVSTLSDTNFQSLVDSCSLKENCFSFTAMFSTCQRNIFYNRLNH